MTSEGCLHRVIAFVNPYAQKHPRIESRRRIFFWQSLAAGEGQLNVLIGRAFEERYRKGQRRGLLRRGRGK
jgi:hypothetical protein